MVILGINAYHGDASAAVLVDGQVVAAVEEERFTRNKHQAGFPAEAIRWCLEAVGASFADIEHVGVSRDPLTSLHHKAVRVLADRPSLTSLRQRAASQGKILGIRQALAAALGTEPKALKATFHRVQHHRAHLASAAFCSPYDEAACLSVDGMGDFYSSMWGRIADNRCSVDAGVRFPDSLGVYYTAFTQFLGMPSYGDEYKLMGLSAYGKPTYLEDMRDVLTNAPGVSFKLDLDYFVHHQRGVDMTWASGSPTLSPMFSDRMAERFGPARAFRAEVTERDCDLAASVQARLEEVELELLRQLHERVPSRRLVLAGGVALNCVVNGRITDETPFEEVWIQPAANDSGTSIGAALWIWNQILGRPRSWVMDHAFLGPAFDDAACAEALAAGGLEGEYLDDRELSVVVARRISEGAIVGWYQGATEFGPRALGNRSIVCDPRRTDMKDILNARIKFREPFRPFAPSVLAEEAGAWFERAEPSPFMLMAYGVRRDRRSQLPAVTHEDGTARVQTVTRGQNARYYDLISEFGRLTGVPVLLNTSFNENEPIVCTPREAVDCFSRTQMDVLVLGNRVVDRSADR